MSANNNGNLKQVVLTNEGLEKLEQELEELKTVKRKEISEKIKVALGFGDLSENSEYDEAKNEQAMVESRIVQLENMLKNAKVLDDEEVGTDKVTIGSRVTVRDMETKDDMEFTLVGSTEADPSQGRISDESPLGHALIGKRKNAKVEVQAPIGVLIYKVLKIER